MLAPKCLPMNCWPPASGRPLGQLGFAVQPTVYRIAEQFREQVEEPGPVSARIVHAEHVEHVPAAF